MSQLTKQDYIKILEYYKKPIPKSKELLKKHAENILSTKLCKCIKKVDPINEEKSLGICTKTIINRKGYTRGKFTCKGKKSIKLTKIMKNKTNKRKEKKRK